MKHVRRLNGHIPREPGSDGYFLDFITARRILMQRIYIARCMLYGQCPVSLSQAGVLSKWLNGSSWFSACENLYFSLVLSYFAALYWNSCITVIPSRTLSQTLNLAISCFFSRRHATVESVASLVRPSPVYHTERPPLFTTR